MKKVSMIVLASILLTGCQTSTTKTVDSQQQPQEKEQIISLVDADLNPIGLYNDPIEQKNFEQDSLLAQQEDDEAQQEEIKGQGIQEEMDEEWKIGSNSIIRPLETNAIAYPAGKEIQIDLDGDGIVEYIKYEVTEEENKVESGEKTWTYREIFSELYIDGRKRLTADSEEGELILETPENSFIIVDIDKQDNYQEIGLIDAGPSADYTTTYLRYDKGKILCLGMTYKDGNGVKGDGRVVAREGADILQTWWINKTYELKNNQLVEMKQDIYETNFVVGVLMELPLYKEQDESSETFKVRAGEKVRFIGTDNRNWVLIETQDGQKGWLKIEGYSTIQNVGHDAIEVFDGLCYAG